jgi:hypothetical protein
VVGEEVSQRGRRERGRGGGGGRERERGREAEGGRREREREREMHARTHTQMPLRRLFPLLLLYNLAPTGSYFGLVCGHLRRNRLPIVFRLLPLL